MILKPDQNNDNQDHDFFDGPELPDPVKKPKAPKLQPDDPKYWENESEWEHLRIRRSAKKRVYGWIALAAIVIGLIIAFYMRFYSPYIDEATQYGYVESIENKGTVFHTYEGVLLPYKELRDTSRVYQRDFVFSVSDPHVAASLKRLQKAGLPAMVEYRQYHATLPWRGNSKIIIVKADTADPKKIMPIPLNP